jgi:peroxiredoxin
MAVDVGGRAPDFTLPDQDRQPFTLSEQLKQGPVVLAFFPGAFSGTCTKEFCTFRDDTAGLEALPGTVIGVSVDTFFALKGWADALRLPFRLLSDFNKTVIREYGVFNDDMIGLKGIAKRAVFVIDGDGTVRHREVLDDARNEPDYAAIAAALKKLPAARH